MRATIFAASFLVGYLAHDGQRPPTEREIVEILANYDVRHVPQLPGVPYYGATDMDNHVIYIVDNTDFVFKRRTVIHELTHIVMRMRNIPDTDEQVESIIEDAEYSRLFGENK